MLLFVLHVVDTPSEGEEEFGEEFAGEEPGQPEPTGKPPLTLASLLHPNIYMHLLWLYTCIYPLVSELLRHSDTTPLVSPVRVPPTSIAPTT